MRFKLGHPSYPQYAFNLLDVTPQAERRINRLSPVSTVSRAFDWPQTFGGYRGWTDTFNSIWWPRGADQFATCVLVLDDARNDLLRLCVEAQRAALPSTRWEWPYLVLQSLLAPVDNGIPADSFPARGVDPVAVETELMAWKMYPLTPINVSSLDSSEAVRGLWLLPLVDIRYLMRNVPLNVIGGGVSSGSGQSAQYPVISVTPGENPDWMPPLRGYPYDIAAPMYYTAIADQGTVRSVGSDSRLGKAADLQAAMQSWRVVCRDVRSRYNAATELNSHNLFSGVVSDYPEQWSLPADDVTGYHVDAVNFLEENNTRYAGGLSDVRTLDDLMYRKIQFVFDIDSDPESVYSVTLRMTADFPTTVSDFLEDFNGPDETEKKQIPVVLLGKTASSGSPGPAEHSSLVAAAKQWYLIYCWWRRKQAYIKFPGIYPVIPNGHAQMIRWDFRSSLCETTYVAVEGVEGFTTDRPGVGSSPQTCFNVLLTEKTYVGEVGQILYAGYRVTDISDGQALEYEVGELVELPIFHLNNVDLPVWIDRYGSSDSSGVSSVPEECVVRVCKGAGDWYIITAQPRVEIVKMRTDPVETETVHGVTYQVHDLMRFDQTTGDLVTVKKAYAINMADLVTP